MKLLTSWLNPKRLLLVAYLLLWPPFLLLASRKSFQADVLGWWSDRVFSLMLGGLAVLAVTTLMLVLLLRRDHWTSRIERLCEFIRDRWFLAVPVAVLPILTWFGAVWYLVVYPIPLTLLPFLAVLDLVLLVLVWEAGLLFLGQPEEQHSLLVKKCMLAGASLLMSVALIEIAGNLLGQAAYFDWETNPRNLDVRFKTDDFDTRVITNQQGLRESRTIHPEHPGIFRIVAIGDSYTFGWGVEHDEAYPKVTESALRNTHGLENVEVINMGKPGAAPDSYLKFVRRYAVRLKPDMIVIGFLVGNDCPVFSPAHLRSEADVQDELSRHVLASHVSPVRQLLLKSYLFRLIQARVLPRIEHSGRFGTVGNAGPIFGEPNPLDPAEMKAEIRRADDPDDAARRYEHLKREGWVEKGLRWRLNPWLVKAVILRPGGIADSLAVRPATKQLMPYEWRLCEELLLEIKTLCDEIDAELVVVSLPNAHQVSGEWNEFLGRLGCDVYDEMTTTDIVNGWMTDFCRENHLTSVDPLHKVREEWAAGEKLYFTYDNHMTPKGYRIVGEAVAEVLSRLIETERSN
jgi:lysophospholipase L1-like esterase